MDDLNSTCLLKSLARYKNKHVEVQGISEMSAFLQQKFELTSSIPKPIKLGRRSSSVSPITHHYSHQNCLTPSFVSADFGIRSRSTLSRHDSFLKTYKLPVLSPSSQGQKPSKLAKRPKSARVLRTTQTNSQYGHIKAKINSNIVHPALPTSVPPMSPKTRPTSAKLICPLSPKLSHPVSPKPVRPDSPNLFRPLSPNAKSGDLKSNKSSISAESKTSLSMKSGCVPIGDKQLIEEEIGEKQNNPMTTYNELTKLQMQTAAEEQVLEIKLCPNISAKPKSPPQENLVFSPKDSPEFLSKFEKQIEKVLESWLRFICDVIAHKLMIGNSSLSRITLPDTTQDPRNEVYKFLAQMPTEGDSLQGKLHTIEEELFKVITVVMHNVTALWKDFEDLKDKYWRLEKTQDKLHSELQEELALLNEENKALHKKYTTAVDKLNQEKVKYEGQEKHKLLVNKDASEMKKKIKFLEGKCAEWQLNINKVETVCKSIELMVRNTQLALDKDGKNYRDLHCKHMDAQEKIKELKAEIAKRNNSYLALEAASKKLQQEFNIIKTTLDESLKKRKELTEDLADKAKILNDAEHELNQIRTYVNNNNSSDPQNILSSEVLIIIRRDMEQRNSQIEELKKKLKFMENELNEKSINEGELKRQLQNLQVEHKCENEVALTAQITKLQYAVKDLTEENAELEKIVAQKTIEIDQRDLMMKQNSKIMHARDEIIPWIQSRQSNQRECTERLRAFILEHQKTYIMKGNGGFSNNEKNNTLDVDNDQDLENFVMSDHNQFEQELSFHKEKMMEVYSLLENKQREMMRLEHRLRDLQRLNEEKERLEQERERKYAAIQQELQEAKESNTNKSRGFFSFFTSQNHSG